MLTVQHVLLMYVAPQEQGTDTPANQVFTPLDDKEIKLSLGEGSNREFFDDIIQLMLPKDPTDAICHLTNIGEKCYRDLIDIDVTK